MGHIDWLNSSYNVVQKKTGKNESKFLSVFQQDFYRLWQRNGYMDKRRKNGTKMRGGGGWNSEMDTIGERERLIGNWIGCVMICQTWAIFHLAVYAPSVVCPIIADL